MKTCVFHKNNTQSKILQVKTETVICSSNLFIFVICVFCYASNNFSYSKVSSIKNHLALQSEQHLLFTPNNFFQRISFCLNNDTVAPKLEHKALSRPSCIGGRSLKVLPHQQLFLPEFEGRTCKKNKTVCIMRNIKVHLDKKKT